MKNLILTICLSVAVSFSFGQIDVVGPGGDVGIGISNPTQKLDVGGNALIRGGSLSVGKGAGSGLASLQIGNSRATNGQASFELIADKNVYPDWGFRFIRYPNGFTNMDYRGTQSFVINGKDGGSVFFGIQNNAKFSVQNNKIQSEVQAYKPGGGPWRAISDKRLKSDINSYEKGLEEILKIKPVSYKYTAEFLSTNDETYVGVVAQDLQKVAPSMVKEYEFKDIQAKKHEGYLSVDPNEFTYMLINSVKEQQEIIVNLQNQINDLSKTVAELQVGSNDVLSLSNLDINKAHLAQNTPNPLKDVTRIEYFLPESSKTASINVFNLSGKLIKSENLSVIGLGNINLKVSDIASGLYTYSLVVDGTTIDTKKMIIE